MSKKRPRASVRRVARSAPVLLSKRDPAYWVGRLLKNTFTYQGRRQQVRGWAVKIQFLGKRKTFSLASGNPQTAAREACRIYQELCTHGWAAVTTTRTGRRRAEDAPKTTPATTTPSDLEYWKPRLVFRRYPEPNGKGRRPFSVLIEHGGKSGCFPLGTWHKNAAAGEAIRRYQTIVQQGWAAAEPAFVRELTLAFRWSDRPLTWTYTTLHTQTSDRPAVAPRQSISPASRQVAIIEPDAGLRWALMACVNAQKGFHCCMAHASVAELLQADAAPPIDCLLINDAAPAPAGAGSLEDLRRCRPHRLGLLYSVCEDSDQLFLSTPGGVGVYLLKRIPPHRIFEPLEPAVGPLTRELIATTVGDYFQRLVAPQSAHAPVMEMARLTRREREILTLLAKGAPAKEIADLLRISIWTVQGHVKNIFEKLNVHSRTEAVVKFLQK